MSIISGQISYIDDAFGSIYAQVEDDTASQVSGINGPRSGRWSVSTRNSCSSEIDDRTPTVWNGSAVGSDSGQSQAQRKHSALDGSLLRKLAAVTLQEKAQAAQLAQGPEPGSASVVSKHSVRAPSTVAQEKPKVFFVPTNLKHRQAVDRSQCEPVHRPAHATVQHPPPTPHSVKHETVPSAALAGTAKDSRAQRKVHIKGRAGQEITLDLPALSKVPMPTSAVPAPVFGRSPMSAPTPAPVTALSSSRHATSKPARNAARPGTSGGVIEGQHQDRQQVERDRARVATTAAKALMSGVLPSPAKSDPYKPNTPPKHAWVESVHSSSKDSGVDFGGLWEVAPPASTHSRQSKQSIAGSAKSLQDAVKQITAKSNASHSQPQAAQASVNEIAASNGGKSKPPSLQGSGCLNILERTPSRSLYSMQKSEGARTSLWDAVKQISTNSESEKAGNGGWEGIAPRSRHSTKAGNGRRDDAVQHIGSQARSARQSNHAQEGHALPDKHSTAASNIAGWGNAVQRASSKDIPARHKEHGWENDAPPSRHSTVASKGDWKDANQQPSSEVKSAKHSKKEWEDDFRSVKRGTKTSNGDWEEAGFGGMFEETAVSHHSSDKSRVSNNLAEAVRHINAQSDHEKATEGDRTHGNVSQKASSKGGWKLNSGSHKDDEPASRVDSGSQKPSTGGLGVTVGFGGMYEEPAASLRSSRASQMSKKELVDAIMQARAGSRQEASHGGWHEIGQGWTQNNGSHRSGARGTLIAKSGGEEASRDLAGRDDWGASAHGGRGGSSSSRSSKPSRISIAAQEEGPTVFAGGGWISPHPLSEASMPQERIVLPPDYVKGTANGILNNVMTYDDWKEVQRSGSAAGLDRTRPGSDRSSCREDHTSHRSGRSGRQHAGRSSSHSQGGSHHTGLSEVAAARYQAELDAIVQQSPPASVMKSSQAGVELKMPWDQCC